jgi:tRNA A-37 threonylcarbamoyl transferase component Bud32
MNINNYGFLFNDISIQNNKIIKKSKNEIGSIKIKKEIHFYKNILENNIDFSIPTIYILDLSNSLIEMEYLNEYQTLTNMFYQKESNFIHTILEKISILHNFYSKNVSKEEFISNLFIETKEKIKNRFNETKWEENALFNKIQTVNGVKIKNMNFYVDKINKKLLDCVNEMNTFTFHFIHGDIHLGNIMMNNDENICFIDPRGYFGNNELIGIKEYDYAKLLFGISGYSVFDEMNISELKIVDNSLVIDFIDKYCVIYELKLFDKFTTLLSLSIWLGNNNTFVNENKKTLSLMISFYLCEKYL